MSNVCLLRRPETSATDTTIICNGITRNVELVKKSGDQSAAAVYSLMLNNS